MEPWKRRMALLLCIMLISLPLVSTLFVTTHIQHDCTGKECVVCSEIELAIQVIINTRLILIVTSVVGAVFLLGKIESFLEVNISLLHKTLISLKVELLE